jgi:hypothetical protein
MAMDNVRAHVNQTTEQAQQSLLPLFRDPFISNITGNLLRKMSGLNRFQQGSISA